MNYVMMSYTLSRQPGFDPEGMFRLTRELDCWGVDLVTLYDRTAAEWRKMADDAGVKIVCHTFMADFNHPDADARAPARDVARRHFDAALVLGAPVLMVTTPPKEGLTSAESRRNWIAGLAEVVPTATRLGLTLTVENFPGVESPFVTAAEFLEARAAVPGLGLTFDDGNAAFGEDPAETVRLAAPHIVHAHFKDWTFSPDPASGGRATRLGQYAKPALVGEGGVDAAACLRALKAIDYRGGINIEYEGDAYPATEAVRRAIGYLRDLETRL